MTALLLAASFALIVAGAFLFTNSIEWLGHRLGLGTSAVGSLLAAVGTALPESAIPVVAVLSGQASSPDIAIGAIIGAPFVLATLAMCLVGGSALVYRKRRETDRDLNADHGAIQRDLVFFLFLFGAGIALGLGLPPGARIAGAVVLVAAYVGYTIRTVKKSSSQQGEQDLKPLFFDRSGEEPPAYWKIVAQVLVGLAGIIGGAELFVHEVELIATSLAVSPLLLALVLAPLATELPEKANSVIWIRENKDDLALGNITGAMVFQSSIPVAFGLVATEWALSPAAIAAGAVGMAGGVVAVLALRRRSFDLPFVLVWGALFAGFLVFAAMGGA